MSQRYIGIALLFACTIAVSSWVSAEDHLPGDVALRKLLGRQTKTIALWPNAAPDEVGEIGDEKVDPLKHLDGAAMIRNVTRPTMNILLPANTDEPTPAVVICPGGGYGGLAAEHEGTEVVTWLARHNVAGIILKYRVPRRNEGYEKHHHALQDVQRAIGLVRHNAQEWKIDPERIGVLGFSAGGHLAATVSSNYEERIYQPVDEADQQSCRPDFTVLIYPAYLTEKTDGDTPDKVFNVDKFSPKATPPTFIAIAQADRFTHGCLQYTAWLTKAKVPTELHVYDGGGHGSGLRVAPLSNWPRDCADWLRRHKFIVQ